MNPQLQKQKERFIRLHSMKDLALKSVSQCIKSYESTEISEEEIECLKASAIKLYYITFSCVHMIRTAVEWLY